MVVAIPGAVSLETGLSPSLAGHL